LIQDDKDRLSSKNRIIQTYDKNLAKISQNFKEYDKKVITALEKH